MLKNTYFQKGCCYLSPIRNRLCCSPDSREASAMYNSFCALSYASCVVADWNLVNKRGLKNCDIQSLNRIKCPHTNECGIVPVLSQIQTCKRHCSPANATMLSDPLHDRASACIAKDSCSQGTQNLSLDVKPMVLTSYNNVSVVTTKLATLRTIGSQASLS